MKTRDLIKYLDNDKAKEYFDEMTVSIDGGIEKMKLNTCISDLMKYFNVLEFRQKWAMSVDPTVNKDKRGDYTTAEMPIVVKDEKKVDEAVKLFSDTAKDMKVDGIVKQQPLGDGSALIKIKVRVYI